MSSSPPPPPPGGQQQPPPPPGGQQPGGQQPGSQQPGSQQSPSSVPPWSGQPPHGRPPQPGPQTGFASPPYSQPFSVQSPPGQAPPGRPSGGGGTGLSFDRAKLTMADYVIAGGTALYFVLALLPWWSYGDALFGYSLSGFDSGSVSSAFLLLVLATAWTLARAVVDLRLGFPRAWITVGLAGLAFLLTLIAWLDGLSLSFQVWPLLGTLTAAAVLVFAVLSLLPELRNAPALPGRLSGATQWANQPPPDPGKPSGPTYAQPGSPPPPPPPPGTDGPGRIPGG